MDGMLALVGFAKLVFGFLVGVVGITVAARVVARTAGFPTVEQGLRAGNAAIGTVFAGAILAMAILVRHAVAATFGALDLLLHGPGERASVAWVLLYAAGHLVLALGVGVVLLILGTRTFLRLTPDLDEVAEIRKGNVASALVLAAVLVALALLTQHGVETMLDGVLPLPTLGRDAVVAPG